MHRLCSWYQRRIGGRTVHGLRLCILQATCSFSCVKLQAVLCADCGHLPVEYYPRDARCRSWQLASLNGNIRGLVLQNSGGWMDSMPGWSRRRP